MSCQTLKFAAVKFAAVLSLAAVVVGCSGKLSQKDMLRNAIRRPSDDEDDEPTPTPPVVAARPAAGNGGAAAAEGPSPAVQPAQATAGQTTAGQTTQPAAAVVAKPPVAGAPAGASPAAPPAAGQVTATAGASLPARAGVALADFPDVKPPAEPLSPDARRQRAARNLEAIATALHEYSNVHRRFPAAAVGKSRPLLSWRVEILPQLGLRELYDQFHLDEPWNSPHNRQLLSKIPEVYQSPERFDEKTNYLVPVSSGTIYVGNTGLAVRSIDDGLANTIVVLEVDDAQAVPWTQPSEYAFDPRSGFSTLGQLREGLVYVGWGDGTASQIERDTPPRILAGLFSPDGGEATPPAEFHREIQWRTAEPPGSEAVAEATPPAAPPATSTSVVTQGGSAGVAGVASPGGDPRKVPLQSPSAAATPAGRLAIPPVVEVNKAKSTLKKIYEKEWEEADTHGKRQQIAKKMVERATEIHEDVTGKYALLSVARDIAIQALDIELAIRASEQLGAAFATSANELKFDAVDQMVKIDRARNDTPGSGGTRTGGRSAIRRPTRPKANSGGPRLSMERARMVAEQVVLQAVEDEQFALAEKAARTMVTAAKAQNRDSVFDAAVDLQNRVRAHESAYNRAQPALQRLEDNPDDGMARYALGSYLCFYQSDWTNGIPILAKCSHQRMATVCQKELEEPAGTLHEFQIADQWWMLGDQASEPFESEQMWDRAVEWYRKSLPKLPNGLQKIKAEKRIAEREEAAKKKAAGR